MVDSIEIIPTVVPAEAEAFTTAVSAVRSFAPALHLDITDGLFTPVFSWPYGGKGMLISAPVMLGSFPIEAHLMVQDPREIGDMLIAAGAHRIIAHIESFKTPEEARDALSTWREGGAEVGLAILIETPIGALEGAAEVCDCVQVMSIAKIGAQGALFDVRAFERVGEIHRKYPHAVTSVDGGVRMSNIAELTRVGARRFAIGSAIMREADPATAYERLKVAAEHALR